MVDEARPHAPELAEAVRDVLRLVATHEGADDGNFERCRRVDDLLQVRVRRASLGGIGVQVVRVVGERGDLEPVLVEHSPHRAGIEARDVDVGRARVATSLGARCGPARDFEHLEAFARGPGSDLGERSAGERSGEQSEFHVRGTSTQRRSRLDSATASQRTFST